MAIATLDRISISDETGSTRIKFGGIRFRAAILREYEIRFSFGRMEKYESQNRMTHATRIGFFRAEIGTTDGFVRIVGFIEREAHDREIRRSIL